MKIQIRNSIQVLKSIKKKKNKKKTDIKIFMKVLVYSQFLVLGPEIFFMLLLFLCFAECAWQ